MNGEDLKHFEGGADALREGLNKIVDAVNELRKEVKAIKNWPEQTMVVHDSPNERLKRVTLKACTIVADLGEISCDCPSSGEVGGA